ENPAGSLVKGFLLASPGGAYVLLKNMSQASSLTPVMQQFWNLKEEAEEALLLFRMVDFYELFVDDAVEASRILNITLTSRNKNDAEPLSMAGVPHHSLETYLNRLLAAGKKVAIGEQVGDA